MNRKIVLSIAMALTKSWVHSVLPDKILSPSKRIYFSLQAHPDDEILKAGIDQRIIAFSKNPVFTTLTDGNRNTSEDRVAELGEAFKILGYNKDIKCFLYERDILDLVCTEQGQSKEVPLNNIKRVAEMLREKSSAIENMIEGAEASSLLVPDYAGGHFIHDLTQMVGVAIARRIAKRRKIEVYEFPQYYLRLKIDKEVTPEKVQELVLQLENAHKSLRVVRKSLTDLFGVTLNRQTEYSVLQQNIEYRVGDFVEGKGEGLTDPGIGMYNGIIHLTGREFQNKLAVKEVHQSQKASLGRMLAYGTVFGDFSVERLREVNLDRDFRIPPNTKIRLYEVVPWRPHADFKTFKRIYEEITSKE